MTRAMDVLALDWCWTSCTTPVVASCLHPRQSSSSRTRYAQPLLPQPICKHALFTVAPRASLGLLNTLQAELMEHFGIEFSNLFTMTNMPIKRYSQHASQTTRTTRQLQRSHCVSVLFPASGLPTF